MSLPQLPAELWLRVLTHLDPATLSRVSEVNQAFHKLATDESLFLLRVKPNGTTNPAQLFRRLEALYYPAETRISAYSSARTELLGVVDETLVMCDYERCRLICFPSGLSVDIEMEFDSNETFLMTYPQLSNPEKRHVVLPEGHLGFFHSFVPTYFAVLNVNDGGQITFPAQIYFPSQEGISAPKEILDGKHMFAAGNNSEWIAYHTGEHKIALMDWMSGELVREIDVPVGEKYLIGECPAIDGSSIVGLVSEENYGLMKEIRVRGFDDVEMGFRIDGRNTVHSVLRSADTRTYVMITTLDSDEGKMMRFIARRKEGRREKAWEGTLSMRGFPELRENGSVIASRRGKLPKDSSLDYTISELAGKSSPQQVWVELRDDGGVQGAIIPTPVYGELPVWFRRTVDGGWAVFRDTGEYNLALVHILDDARQVRRWHVRDIISVHVVGDHYIVAQNRGGKIVVFHFDWFCHGASGVYACPGAVEDEDEDMIEGDGFM